MKEGEDETEHREQCLLQIEQFAVHWTNNIYSRADIQIMFH